MKISRTLIILWLASLTLFAGTGFVIAANPEALDGVSGWAIRFFLGYCGIIVVSQVLAAMQVVRQLLDDGSTRPLSWHQLWH